MTDEKKRNSVVLAAQEILQPLQKSWKDIKVTNENTPKTKLLTSGTISFASTSSTLSSSGGSSKDPQLSVNSPSFIKTQYSTPKNFQGFGSSESRHTAASNDCEFSITNPFENHSNIDSLLQPSLSPSIFSSVTNNTVNESVCQSPGSFWSIDQIALMKPADIDLSKIHEQQNFVRFEPAKEHKTQKAIDSFFAKGINITSPWSSASKPQYFAIVSPAVPLSSKKKTRPRQGDVVNTPSAFMHEKPLIEKEENSEKVTVSTQTDLSIPFELDLSKILSKYYFDADGVKAKPLTEVQSSEGLGNSSLRRKLFFQDPENDDDCCFADLHPDQVQNEKKGFSQGDVFPMVSDSSQGKTKGVSIGVAKTPLVKSTSSAHTLSTCQSPFSSSPVTGGRMFDLGTPCHAEGAHQMEMDRFSPGPDYSPIHCGKSLNATPKVSSRTETTSGFSSNTAGGGDLAGGSNETGQWSSCSCDISKFEDKNNILSSTQYT